MAALNPLLDILFPDRMIIFLFILRRIAAAGFSPVKVMGLILRPVKEHRIRDLLVHALRPSHREIAAVVSGQRRIQREHDGLPVSTPDHRGHHIPLRKGLIFQEFIVAFVLPDIIPESGRL